ncbi:hypothetical protein [Kiloniella laminariae]|uniref:hypothetical protein n=1 Tax=Kiloniella laminariae TaxID=454162 RepID=UPI00036AB282|nr:hypothetical protein [Kiloniella laminariae]
MSYLFYLLLLFCPWKLDRYFYQLQCADKLDTTALARHFLSFILRLLGLGLVIAYYLLILRLVVIPGVVVETAWHMFFGALFGLLPLFFALYCIREALRRVEVYAMGRIRPAVLIEKKWSRDRENGPSCMMTYKYRVGLRDYTLSESEDQLVASAYRVGYNYKIIHSRSNPAVAFLYTREDFNSYCIHKDKILPE